MPLGSVTHREQIVHARAGVTLIELLIVITILTIVTAASIPMMLSGVEQRRARESARLVSSYFESAKARAIETGRPAGVSVQRMPGGLVSNAASMNLTMVEVPPPYSGDTLVSTAIVSLVSAATAGPPAAVAVYKVTFSTTDAGASQLSVGDIIKFGYQGRNFLLVGANSPQPNQPFTPAAGQPLPTSGTSIYSNIIAADNIIIADGVTSTGSWTPPMITPNGIAYQVIRQPMKSAVQPLQLPEGVVIDVQSSGLGSTATFGATDANPITVTFTPTGNVDRLYALGQLQGHPTSAVCFLIGRPDKVSATGGTLSAQVSAGGCNLNDGDAIWVAISPQGKVTSAENDISAADALTASPAGLGPRTFVLSGKSMGGR